jgi:PTH2 family peptidyl-tRNA hydrolase
LRKESVKDEVSSVTFRYKQVLILRSDLKMSCGKAAAQACHAAVSAAEKTRKTHPSWWRGWMKEGQRKIALKVSSELELLEIEKKTEESKIPTVLISDTGLTELPPGTVTALGIGPATSNLVDKITGNLPLY